MTKEVELKERKPCAELTELTRLTENGRGPVHWVCNTDHDLATVKMPGFFRLHGQGGIRKHDRIDVVCEQYMPVVTHATLVVVTTGIGAGFEVAQFGDALVVEIGHMTPFERLGVPMTANKNEIDSAYRERAKTLHPDKGGSTAAMTALNKARDAADLLCEHLATQKAQAA